MPRSLRTIRTFATGLSLMLSLGQSAAAVNTGPADYYVVQRDLPEIDVLLQGSKTPVKVSLRKGQLISLNRMTPFSQATLSVDKVVNGRVLTGQIAFEPHRLRLYFGPALNPANGVQKPDQELAARVSDSPQGKFIRLDSSPFSLGTESKLPGDSRTKFLRASDYPPQTSSGGTQISLMQSKIVDLGANGVERMQLVHQICLEKSRMEEQCGWVRNDLLSRGDTALSYQTWATAEVGPGAKTIAEPCNSRDSMGQASHFGSLILRGIDRLPNDEQNAREKIRGAVGMCAVKPPTLPYWLLPTKALTQRNINLYEGLARSTALEAFKHVNGAASHVFVRGAPDSPQHALPQHALTSEEFVTIDALARTVFAEMRGSKCATKPYMEATSRVIINRAVHPNRARFRKKVGSAQHPILQAIVSDQAFSAWNNDNEIVSTAKANKRKGKKMRPALKAHLENTKNALCPSADKLEQAAWQTAVDVAMHTVLDEEAFLNETKSLEGIRYYTSNHPYDPADYTSVTAPILDGDRLTDPACMAFWKANDE